MVKQKGFEWDHVTILKKSDKGMPTIQCKHCGHAFVGGPFRIRAHLLGLKGLGVDKCCNIDATIKEEVKKLVFDANGANVDVNVESSQECNAQDSDIASKAFSHANVVPTSSTSINEMPPSPCFSASTSKKRLMNNGEPLKVSWQKQLDKNADEAIRRFFFVEDIPDFKIGSVYFCDMIKAVANVGPSYKPPSPNQLRRRHLNEEVKYVETEIMRIREKWKTHGCTIVSDGWSDTKNRPIINVLATSAYGTVFLKSIDTSGECKSGEYIFKILKDVILDIGPSNVVQVCMDNASNCVVAGRMIEREWPMIFFMRCTCHCLDLLFEDIGKCAWVGNILKLATKIIVYITRKQYALAMYRKFSDKELLKPSTTRFAYSYIVLSNLLDDRVKGGLRRMVVSEQWCQWKGSKTPQGEEIVSIILDTNFWANVKKIVNVCKPILKVLRLADREGATMGLIFECTQRMIEEIKNNEDVDRIMLDEIREMCLQRLTMLHSPLHATSFLLHPIWREKIQEIDDKINTSWMETVMRYANGDLVLSDVLLDEFYAYRTQEKSTFQVPMANDPTRMHKAIKWWETFGTCTPNLRKLAIRVLSQGSCASSCERNWSTFSLIHTKKRNRLTHAHVEKLVYIHTNHCLLRRIKERGLCLMEITLDMIDKEDDDERLLIMQKQDELIIDESDEVHEDITIDDIEDMSDKDDSPLCRDF